MTKNIKNKLRSYGRRHFASAGMLILSVILVFGGVLSLSSSSAYAQLSDWSTYLGNPGHTGYNGSETIINPSTVKNLVQHWKRKSSAKISTQPIVANNKVYWGSYDGLEHASRLSDGEGIWATFLGKTTNCKNTVLGVLSTATVANESINGTLQPVVYVGGGDNQLYALDARTGAVLWKLLLGSPPESFLYGSPTVYNGSVYIGISGNGDCSHAHAEIVQVDASTGTLQHSFNVVPGGCRGGSVWTSPTIDTATGMLYFSNGESGKCSQKETLTDALVELRASDLSYVDSWQVPTSQIITDGDFGASPTLFYATIKGVQHKMVGLENKNGIYYAFDRTKIGAGPLWEDKIATNPGPSLASSAWDGTYLYISAANTLIHGISCPGSLSALNPANGTLIWHDCLNFDSVGGLMAVPGLIELGVGNTIMIFGTGHGTLLFSFTDTTDSSSNFLGPGTISNGVLYQGNMDGNFYALGT